MFFINNLIRYYPAIIDQVVDDGSCTVIFDGYSTAEMTQASLFSLL